MRSIFDAGAAKYTAIITPSAVDVAPLGLEDMGQSDFQFLVDSKLSFGAVRVSDMSCLGSSHACCSYSGIQRS